MRKIEKQILVRHLKDSYEKMNDNNECKMAYNKIRKLAIELIGQEEFVYELNKIRWSNNSCIYNKFMLIESSIKELGMKNYIFSYDIESLHHIKNFLKFKTYNRNEIHNTIKLINELICVL